jgi:hypothetical protein
MLRPTRLPSPPGWLRRDQVRLHFTAPSEDVVTPASGAARCRTALRVKLDGRTENLPPSGLSPDKSQQLVRLHNRFFQRPQSAMHRQGWGSSIAIPSGCRWMEDCYFAGIFRAVHELVAADAAWFLGVGPSAGRAGSSDRLQKRFWLTDQADWNKSSRRAGERGGARVDRPRWARILTITAVLLCLP